MVGDWIFIVLLLIIFAILIYAGNLLIKSAESITPITRKTDSNLASAYNNYKIAGNISFYTGIFGIVILVLSGIFILVPVTSRILSNGSIIAKSMVKIFFAIIIIAMCIVVGSYLNSASDLILTSRTYKISRLKARAALDNGIHLTNLAALAYYIIAAVIGFIFAIMILYDVLCKSKPTSDTQEDISMSNMYVYIKYIYS